MIRARIFLPLVLLACATGAQADFGLDALVSFLWDVWASFASFFHNLNSVELIGYNSKPEVTYVDPPPDDPSSQIENVDEPWLDDGVEVEEEEYVREETQEEEEPPPEEEEPSPEEEEPPPPAPEPSEVPLEGQGDLEDTDTLVPSQEMEEVELPEPMGDFPSDMLTTIKGWIDSIPVDELSKKADETWSYVAAYPIRQELGKYLDDALFTTTAVWDHARAGNWEKAMSCISFIPGIFDPVPENLTTWKLDQAFDYTSIHHKRMLVIGVTAVGLMVLLTVISLALVSLMKFTYHLVACVLSKFLSLRFIWKSKKHHPTSVDSAEEESAGTCHRIIKKCQSENSNFKEDSADKRHRKHKEAPVEVPQFSEGRKALLKIDRSFIDTVYERNDREEFGEKLREKLEQVQESMQYEELEGDTHHSVPSGEFDWDREYLALEYFFGHTTEVQNVADASPAKETPRKGDQEADAPEDDEIDNDLKIATVERFPDEEGDFCLKEKIQEAHYVNSPEEYHATSPEAYYVNLPEPYHVNSREPNHANQPGSSYQEERKQVKSDATKTATHIAKKTKKAQAGERHSDDSSGVKYVFMKVIEPSKDVPVITYAHNRDHDRQSIADEPQDKKTSKHSSVGKSAGRLERKGDKMNSSGENLSCQDQLPGTSRTTPAPPSMIPRPTKASRLLAAKNAKKNDAKPLPTNAAYKNVKSKIQNGKVHRQAGGVGGRNCSSIVESSGYHSKSCTPMTSTSMMTNDMVESEILSERSYDYRDDEAGERGAVLPLQAEESDSEVSVLSCAGFAIAEGEDESEYGEQSTEVAVHPDRGYDRMQVRGGQQIRRTDGGGAQRLQLQMQNNAPARDSDDTGSGSGRLRAGERLELHGNRRTFFGGRDLDGTRLRAAERARRQEEGAAGTQHGTGQAAAARANDLGPFNPAIRPSVGIPGLRLARHQANGADGSLMHLMQSILQRDRLADGDHLPPGLHLAQQVNGMTTNNNAAPYDENEEPPHDSVAVAQEVVVLKARMLSMRSKVLTMINLVSEALEFYHEALRAHAAETRQQALDSQQQHNSTESTPRQHGNRESPEASHVAPEAGHVAPEAGHVAPEAGHVAPGTGHVAPEVGHVAHEAGHLAPEADHLTPEACHVVPEAGHVAPGLEDKQKEQI